MDGPAPWPDLTGVNPRDARPARICGSAPKHRAAACSLPEQCALGGTEQISIGHQVGVQLLACAVTAAWSGGATWALMKLSDLALGARADEEQEILGLDLTSHEERGYDLT